MKKLWFAVMRDETDDDWGYGSDSLSEAKKMAAEFGPQSYIAVIDVTDDDPLCIAEIPHADFDCYIETEHFQI